MPVPDVHWSLYGLLIPIILSILWLTEWYSAVWGTILAVSLLLFYNRYPVLYFGWIQVLICYLQIAVMVQWFNPYDHNKSLNKWASFLLLFQIGSVYSLNALSKNGNLWMDGIAIEYSLKAFYNKTPLTKYLLNYSGFLHFLNYVVLVWELLTGLLLLISIRYKRLLFPLTACIAVFHFSVSLFLDVGYFSWISLSVLVLGLPQLRLVCKMSDFFIFNKIKAVKIPINFSVFMFILPVFFLISHFSQDYASKERTDWSLRNIFPFSIRHSLFTQYWHFYSPNPPSSIGEMVVIATLTDGKQFQISEGRIAQNPVYKSNLQKYVYDYLTIRYLKHYSVTCQICLLQKEASMWKTNNHIGLSSIRTVILDENRIDTIDNIRINIR
jgi:hypothetical protein